MKSDRLWPVLACVWLLSCGDSTSAQPSKDVPLPDTSDIPDDAPAPSDVPPTDTSEVPPAMRPVPMKEVGNPTHIGTQPIRFTDVTDDVGLPDLLGEAVAFVDFDLDGWPDVLSVAAHELILYRNLGGTFAPVNEWVFDGEHTILKKASNGVFADVDNDGDLDLYVASSSQPDQLFLNKEGVWSPAPALWDVPPSLFVQGVHFADLNNNGWLDAYVTTGGSIHKMDAGTAVAPGYAGNPNTLLRNNEGAGFTDITAAWNALAGDNSETFGALLVDFDRDGDSDALVVRDYLTDHYFRNDGTTFTDTSETAIDSLPTGLMGLAVGDYNGDGHLDVYGTNQNTDYLYQGKGDGTFTNVFDTALQSPDPTLSKTGWGCAFIDMDNDGDQDVLSVAGYNRQEQGVDHFIPPRLGGYVALENTGNGQLTDITNEAGLTEVIHGLALATADFDLDGDLDAVAALGPPVDVGFGPKLFLVRQGARLLRNDSARAAGNHFLELSLRQPVDNRFAVGAIIDVQSGTMRSSRVITAGDSYLSAHSFVQHFGLGFHTEAVVTIQWPNGLKQVAQNVPAGYHRLLPFDGSCCHPDSAQKCDSLPTCPVWAP
jgi:hypothetical protein